MVDLETLDTSANTVVTSIGIVEFDKNEVRQAFEVHIDIQNQLEFFDRTVSASTMLWWLEQSGTARGALIKGQANAVPLGEALNQVSKFIQHTKENQAILWGNGAAFDNAKLEELYIANKSDAPWKFWNDRCYRTLKATYPNIKADRAGTHHKAVDDAYTQAMHLIEINKQAGGIYL